VPSPARHGATRQTEVELFSVAGFDGHLQEVNESFERLLGRSPGEINGRSLLELVHPDDLEQVVAGLAALEGGAVEALLECRFIQQDGRTVHLQWVARPVPGTDSWWAAGRDTTEFHRLVAERSDFRARMDLALGQATAAMWELDVGPGRLTWEPQAAAILGVTAEAVPASAAELAATADPEDSAQLLAGLQQLVDLGMTDVEFRVGAQEGLRHLSLRGKVLDRDRRGRPLRAVGLVLDVTTEKAMEEQMRRMIMSDALTGVPNRRAFDRTLRTEWRRCSRAGEPLSLLMIDIDNFKSFNDTYGHLVGDEVLCLVARALTNELHRAGDVVARFGGEEFAVVLPNTDAAGAFTVATALVDAVRAVTLRKASDWGLSVSVGTATAQPDATTIKSGDLLGRADEALYAAKAEGKNRAVAYEHALAARASLEAAITRGIAAGEFELYYQPIISLETGTVTSFEALMRWNRPGHGLLAPFAFIPVAEGSDLICDLGRWALREAACQLATWSRQLDTADLRIAVNASGRHVSSPDIVGDIRAALTAAGIAPGQLELELTETTLLDDLVGDKHLAAVRGLGVAVAIDDFGTGHTSIGQLPRLPVDILKIDRSFIASEDPRQQALITVIIEAAHAFDLRVVAEGVEDEQTLQSLRELGCDTAQGYHLARPMPAGRVPAWLDDWQTTLETPLNNPTPQPAQVPRGSAVAA
jgi:diguanylate cyclase (GGDEF)-like protein/PAS domain S-box-containing protein